MKFLIAIAMALGIAAIAYGAAASIVLTPQKLGASDPQVTACSATANASWSVVYDVGSGKYDVQNVIFTAGAGCNGATPQFTLTDGVNSLGSFSGNAFAGGTSTTNIAASLIPASSVNSITVAIVGP